MRLLRPITNPLLRLDPVVRFVVPVTAVGVAVLGLVLGFGWHGALGNLSVAYLIFAAGTVIGECCPLRMMHPGSESEITASSTFSFALLLAYGAPAALLAQAVGAIASDLLHRKSADRICFNVAQYSLSLGVAAGVLAVLTDVPRSGPFPFGPADLPAIALAGAAFFVVNASLVAGVICRIDRADFWPYLRKDFVLQTSTVGVLLGLAPIAVLAADFSVAVLPVLGLPLLAVHRAGRHAHANQRQALHDALTDLPNRALLRDRIEHALRFTERDRKPMAVMLIDLDHFKEVNDTLGHHHGDALLQAIGPRLTATLRATDTVARLGGDEFAVVLPHVQSQEEAMRIATALRATIDEPFTVQDLELRVGASIGMAWAPRDGTDVDTLLRRADVAMYRAKRASTGVEFYSEIDDDHSPERLRLAGELRRSLPAGEFLMHYQPQAALADRRLGGMEALMRWQHPRRGLLAPDAFIPLAERAGLITRLTVFALHAAAEQAHTWRLGGRDLTVAVNLSARCLLDRSLIDEVEAALSEADVPSSALKLEITESMIMVEPARALAVLQRLSDMGVQLSVDDFGTGYSSLANLKRMPVDEIKIDRSFVVNMATDAADRAIVRSTVQLAHSLGLRVVAEGVETAPVWEMLGELDCDLAQGFHLSRPLPAAQLLPGPAAWAAETLAAA